MKKIGGILLLIVGIVTIFRAIIDLFGGNFAATLGLLFGIAISFLGYKLFTAKPKQAQIVQNVQPQNSANINRVPDGARPFRTNLVGCKFKNEDGSSRQENIERLNIGDRVHLQPYKYKGENAIYVVSEDGIIGNLKKELADEFTSKIKTGYFLYAEVEDIWPYEGNLYLAVILWQKQ